MKVRLLLILARFAIGFAFPALAQQTNAPDPELRETLSTFMTKYAEAFNNGDAVALADFDAERRFGVADYTAEESGECISGLILQGVKKPHECPAFGTRCTPEHPLGATMVSSEGACAAYYQYRRGKL